MYNAVVMSIFKELDIGCLECKCMVAIPSTKRNKPPSEILSELIQRQSRRKLPLLAARFVNLENLRLPFCLNFKVLKENYIALEETDWYINPAYDLQGMKQINRLAEPSILLQCDPKRANYYIGYYVDLMKRGYSQEEALNTIYG